MHVRMRAQLYIPFANISRPPFCISPCMGSHDIEPCEKSNFSGRAAYTLHMPVQTTKEIVSLGLPAHLPIPSVYRKPRFYYIMLVQCGPSLPQ